MTTAKIRLEGEFENDRELEAFKSLLEGAFETEVLSVKKEE